MTQYDGHVRTLHGNLPVTVLSGEDHFFLYGRDLECWRLIAYLEGRERPGGWPAGEEFKQPLERLTVWSDDGSRMDFLDVQWKEIGHACPDGMTFCGGCAIFTAGRRIHTLRE